MTDGHVPPNFLNPEAINEVLETPGRGGVVRFPTGVRPFGMLASHTVLVESTPEGDWWRAPTSEERAAEWEAEREAERVQERAIIAAHGERVATATGLRRAVLELHAPDEYGLCQGCVTDCCAPKVSDCPTYTLARDWQE